MRMPSKAQFEAINHVNGPAILIAGPGSGKTFTIVQRLKYLIDKKNIPPNQILVVTFSKAAAKEMHDRFISDTNEYAVNFGTFHSLAYNILKSSFKLRENDLINDNDKYIMLKQIIINHGYKDFVNREQIQVILDTISKYKNSKSYNNYSLTSFSEEISTEELNIIIKEFDEFKKESNKFDFDDMILSCLTNLKKNADILNIYQNKYKYILVDEFQDINIPQYELIKLLSKPLNNIFVVGDDDQSIYMFRGAYSQIMKQFLNDYPDAKSIYLTENYRSGEEIVYLASKIISKNMDRFNKNFMAINKGGNIFFNELSSRKDEEKYIIDIINGFTLEERKNTAIIVRTNMEASLYKNILKKNNLYDSDTIDNNIYKSFIFDDIVYFLKYIYEDNKRAYFIQFMNKPNKYIQRMSLINENVNENDIYHFYKNNIDMINIIKNFFNKLKLAQNMNCKNAILLFLNSIGYKGYIKDKSKNDIDYENNITIVNRIIALFEDYNKTINLDNFINSFKSYEVKKKDDFECDIKIITMHASKGLEFETVILPDINEGIIPSKNLSDEEINEERRLLYVAVTRAKKNLYIISNTERNRRLSRFLEGISFDNYIV